MFFFFIWVLETDRRLNPVKWTNYGLIRINLGSNYRRTSGIFKKKEEEEEGKLSRL